MGLYTQRGHESDVPAHTRRPDVSYTALLISDLAVVVLTAEGMRVAVVDKNSTACPR
jgi:hypothetical protein